MGCLISRHWRASSSLQEAISRCARYSEDHYFALGLAAWVIPLAGVVDYIVGNTSFNTFYIRLSAAVLAIPLLFYKSLPPRFRSFFPYYFVGIAAYALPFTYGIMLTTNAVLAPVDFEIHFIWILQYFIALFLFIQLIIHGPLATVLWFITSTTALLPIVLVDSPNFLELKRVLLYPISAYLTAIFFGILTSRHTDIIYFEKLRTAAAIGANLAHELRTPLASIRNLAQGTDNLLPTLTDAYKKAKENGIEVGNLRSSQVETLSNVLERIRNEVTYSNTIIDMLLLNTADKSLTDVQTEKFSVKGCIEEAISRYPFNNQDERNLIEFRLEQDFEINAPRLLIVHVLFNLIKNALLYTQKSGKGRVLISAQQRESNSTITVHDNGPGIPPHVRAHIFERFYTTTTTGQGAGIGLSFCRMVMDAIGGSIECDSVEGEYTTFTLHFKNPLQTPTQS